MSSLFRDAARDALAEGVRTGAQRAGIDDPKAIASIQTEVDEKYWEDFKTLHPSPAEARMLGVEFVKHALDHMAGRNTSDKLQELRAAAWAGERSRQRSNAATDEVFLKSDAWLKADFPKLYALLKHGVGNRPAVARFVVDRYSAAHEADRRKDRAGSFRAALGKDSGGESATALRVLGDHPLNEPPEAA
jgi:hypothetical protein